MVLPAPGPSGQAAAQSCPGSHTVVRGDTLSLLSRQYYGDVSLFRRIYDANRAIIGPNPSIIEIGAVLAIPCPPGVAPQQRAAVEPGQTTETPTQTPTQTPAEQPVEQPTGEAAEQPVAQPEQPDAEIGALTEAPPLPEGWSTILSVADAEALARAGSVQFLDIRPLREGSAVGYVPGSVALPVAMWQGRGAGPVPTDVTLSVLIGENGLRTDLPMVIVATGQDIESLADAAWVYWLLRSAGAQRVAILEPGFTGWQAANARVTTRPSRPRARQAQVTLDQSWRAQGNEVVAIRDGAVDGALFQPDLSALVAVDPLLQGEDLPLQALRAFAVLDRLKAYRIEWEAEPVIAVDEDPRRAALAWFYASEVGGIRNVRLYPAPLSNLSATVTQ